MKVHRAECSLSALLPLAIALLAPACLASNPDGSSKPDDQLAPLAFLAGHCWEGEFGNGHRDVQCYEWVYDGKFLRSDHHVIGTEPRYEGITWYSWDAQNNRIRFHYFTSLGAVSEGHLETTAEGFVVPEEHRDGEGKLTRIQTLFKQIDPLHYSAGSQIWSEDGWQPMHTAVYRRQDAPAADPQSDEFTTQR